MTILPERIREDIALQIAERWPASSDELPTDAAIGLGESLRVVLLPIEQVRTGAPSLAECLVDTRQWHHQLYYDGRAVTFARTIALEGGENSHRVVEVAQSGLPAALKRSIDWVDQHLPGAQDAEILFAPAFALAGLFVHRDAGDAVVLSILPGTISNLEVNRELEPEEFLYLLSLNEPVQGLGPLEGGGTLPA